VLLIFVIIFKVDAGLSRDAVSLHGPVTKIDLLAALGAEGPEGEFLCPEHGFFAGRTVQGSGSIVHGFTEAAVFKG